MLILILVAVCIQPAEGAGIQVKKVDETEQGTVVELSADFGTEGPGAGIGELLFGFRYEGVPYPRLDQREETVTGGRYIYRNETDTILGLNMKCATHSNQIVLFVQGAKQEITCYQNLGRMILKEAQAATKGAYGELEQDDFYLESINSNHIHLLYKDGRESTSFILTLSFVSGAYQIAETE
jgi:hypothetical protein